jgi:predicted RNA binding protein YcfA (HicA-like mRNA interferase family)
VVRTAKLYERARNNPADVRFSDFIRLAEAFGFAFVRQSGSQRLHRHPNIGERLTIQPRKDGKAKPIQVREFLSLIDDYGLSMEDGE